MYLTEHGLQTKCTKTRLYEYFVTFTYWINWNSAINAWRATNMSLRFVFCLWLQFNIVMLLCPIWIVVLEGAGIAWKLRVCHCNVNIIDDGCKELFKQTCYICSYVTTNFYCIENSDYCFMNTPMKKFNWMHQIQCFALLFFALFCFVLFCFALLCFA